MHCDECGFDYAALTRLEISDALRNDAATLLDEFAAVRDHARERPAEGVWSPLEYACHVRDMLDVQRARVVLTQRVDNPAFVPMGRDERAMTDRYNEQDPEVVARALGDAASELAATLDALDATGWQRTGIYNYPAPADRTVEWIGRHTVHELRHHARDIART